MKRIISAIAVALLLTLPAKAFDLKTLTVPTVTGGAVSNSVAQSIYVGAQNNVAIQWTTGSTNVVARYSASVDGSAWMTNYYVVIHRSDTTAGLLTTVTNLDTKGLQYLRLDSVLSTGTINATNTVKYGSKPGL